MVLASYLDGNTMSAVAVAENWEKNRKHHVEFRGKMRKGK